MNLSYWEYKSWLSNIDFAIVGSGIVGLHCALHLREKYPKAKIVILEKGVLPQGASTKNAGFACFGSISEILSDLKTHTKEEVADLVKKRRDGIQLLRKSLGDKKIIYQNHGGHEVFLDNQEDLYQHCRERLAETNELLKPIFGGMVFKENNNVFEFEKVQPTYITHRYESQIDTGAMMQALVRLAAKKKITILNAITVEKYSEDNSGVIIKTDQFEFRTKKLCIATNGFAAALLNENVKPARAQVLITKPIKGLQLKGTFHLEEGYYYFRNVKNRILLGGGRNLDFKGEETTTFGETSLIQNRLEELLKSVILPNSSYEIEHRWSGIMGVGMQKKPIIKPISLHVNCGVRLGGMGIAIGAKAGEELAQLC